MNHHMANSRDSLTLRGWEQGKIFYRRTGIVQQLFFFLNKPNKSIKTIKKTGRFIINPKDFEKA